MANLARPEIPGPTPVRAIADGEIVGVRNGDYGLQILLLITSPHQHPAKVYAFYARLSQASVQQGESVKEGQIIGLTGRSGTAYFSSPTFRDSHSPMAGKGFTGPD